MRNNRIRILFFIIVISVLQSSCANRKFTDSTDPWEDWNRKIHSFNDGLDDYLMKPVAKGYRWLLPVFVDTAVSNVFSNIDDIVVTINDLLQAKFTQSRMDGARFLVNSTAGIGGLFDVASQIGLAKHNEDFGQTLGFWGVPAGPYMVLPLFGPSSPRGFAGIVVDTAMSPFIFIASPYVSGGIFSLNVIDIRADNLETEKIASEAAAFGRYEFFRDAYISRRESLIYDGDVPEDEDFILDDDFDEDMIPDNSY